MPKLRFIIMEIKNQFAKKLMDIQAIKLQPNDPFTWASGWKFPSSARL